MEGRKSMGKEGQFKDIIMPVVFCILWVRDNWIMGEGQTWRGKKRYFGC
jgi:hypothetical protein